MKKIFRPKASRYIENDFGIIVANAITLDNISKNFGSLCVVKELSFEVEDSTCFGFLGPNGAAGSFEFLVFNFEYLRHKLWSPA